MSFMLQLKNVREVMREGTEVREGTEEPNGVVLTQVISGGFKLCALQWFKWQVAVPQGRWDTRAGKTVQVSFVETQYLL